MNKLNHIAFIMDGNGRWGKKKKKSRNFGHVKGVETVKKVVKYNTKLFFKRDKKYSRSGNKNKDFRRIKKITN